jgi:hypothetical protein
MTPTPGTDGCRTKIIRITHICNVPDLDTHLCNVPNLGDCVGSDTTMEIKVLIQDKIYWPIDVRQDCDGGSYRGGCKIPDELLLTECYELRNSVEQVYRVVPNGVDALKITIYDEDFWTNEFTDMYLPREQWYNPAHCGELVINVTSDDGASVRMVIVSEETVPTASPSQSPTTRPPTPAPTPPPSPVPTSSPTTECGFGLGSVADGLLEVSTELSDMQLVMADYGSEFDSNNGGRRLSWGALLLGVTKFTGSVIKGVEDNGPLSTLADFCTIGSTLFSVLGPGDESDARQEELFQQVFERFDGIDRKLADIQIETSRGFNEIANIVNSGFAKQELDDWINVELATLNEDYRAYLNPQHTLDTRMVYEDTFRNSCLNNHSPFTTFKVLYSHACHGCSKLDGQSNQYILDTYVDLAIAKFDLEVEERIKLFRGSFGTVIIGAMVQAIYLHAVCLYQPETVCQNKDSVWRERLQEMGDALEEVAISLSSAEQRVKCRTKKVRITHICNLPDLDSPFIFKDDNMDIKLEIGDEVYWPKDVFQDCSGGMGAFNNACIIPDEKLMNGCYALTNNREMEFTSPQTLTITIRDKDIGFDDIIRYFVDASEWYDSMQCATFQLEQIDRDTGAVIKVTIESEVLNEPWGIL